MNIKKKKIKIEPRIKLNYNINRYELQAVAKLLRHSLKKLDSHLKMQS